MLIYRQPFVVFFIALNFEFIATVYQPPVSAVVLFDLPIIGIGIGSVETVSVDA